MEEMEPIHEALCLGCLRVVLTEYEAGVMDITRCECGSEVCPCSSCVECIQLLREGHREKGILATQHDVNTWTETGGVAA